MSTWLYWFLIGCAIWLTISGAVFGIWVLYLTVKNRAERRRRGGNLTP